MAGFDGVETRLKFLPLDHQCCIYLVKTQKPPPKTLFHWWPKSGPNLVGKTLTTLMVQTKGTNHQLDLDVRSGYFVSLFKRNW